MPIPPAVKAKRLRFVRLVAFVAVVGGAGLSAIPSRTVTWRESVTTNGTATLHEMAFHRQIGLPFRTVTLTTGPGRSIQRLSVHSSGLVGNAMVAALAMVAISLRRRGRKEGFPPG